MKLKKKNQKNNNIINSYNTIVKSICTDFKTKKEIFPHIILLSPHKKMIVISLNDCKDFNERTSVLSILGKELKKENVDVNAAILITEGIMVVDENNRYNENEKDVLAFSAIDLFGNHIHSIYEIIEDNNEIEFKDVITSDWVSKDDKNTKIKGNLLCSFWESYQNIN